MGFLRLNASPNLNTAIFSAWVYIPSSLASAVSLRDGGDLATDGTWVMDHAVPLITFGAQQSSIEYDYFVGEIGVCEPHTQFGSNQPVSGGYQYGDHPVAVQPSCIGIAFPSWMGGTTPVLYVNIQGSNSPVCINWRGGSGPGFTCNYLPDGNFDVPFVTVNSHDESYVNNLPQYAALGNAHPALHSAASGLPNLVPNAWNHIIVSWQLANEAATAANAASNGVSATSRLYCSINDANKSGYNLPAGWPGFNDNVNYDPNAASSDMVYFLADSNPAGGYGGTPEISLNWGTIPTNPIWIPGPPTLNISDTRGSTISPNLGIIMADLQLFNGGTALDTGVVANRRLFITDAGTPAALSVARDGLGRHPVIALKGVTNWLRGRNKGSAGDLTVVGTVRKYESNPIL